MRRLLSILLLLGFALGPAFEAIPAHALTADALISGWTGKINATTLPACCRRNGKHHCAMAAPEGETVLTSGECCPCQRHGAQASASNNNFSLTAQVVLLLPAVERNVVSARALNHISSTAEGLRGQRGPPASS